MWYNWNIIIGAIFWVIEGSWTSLNSQPSFATHEQKPSCSFILRPIPEFLKCQQQLVLIISVRQRHALTHSPNIHWLPMRGVTLGVGMYHPALRKLQKSKKDSKQMISIMTWQNEDILKRKYVSHSIWISDYWNGRPQRNRSFLRNLMRGEGEDQARGRTHLPPIDFLEL